MSVIKEFQCDRCRKRSPNLRDWKTVGTKKAEDFEHRPWATISRHLCPDCAKSFDTWLTGRP